MRGWEGGGGGQHWEGMLFCADGPTCRFKGKPQP